MKNIIFILGAITIFSSCEMALKDHDDHKLQQKEVTDSLAKKSKAISIEERSEQLKAEGYETFHYQEGDTTYLMQKYFMVFLKSGKNRSQDSTEAANLQIKHLAHLERMAQEGYTSLTGPFGDDGEIRGIVVYNTPTLKMADSLAHLDPMVKAGRLEVEVHPWWTSKGGKLK
ncbi:YciI family protein [Mesonia sp.]|uniref:YciI family protein n=1 Tax=Mesonia sp. TaxID=1960830 RepID=UPI001774B2B4|nr:YciI family protein [Mesonia sp.]HIB37050.1 hypothetical protein [Mesonia sp.]HIO27290.1 hypothetical protein [Flavobacteriaceae bacterium]